MSPIQVLTSVHAAPHVPAPNKYDVIYGDASMEGEENCMKSVSVTFNVCRCHVSPSSHAHTTGWAETVVDRLAVWFVRIWKSENHYHNYVTGCSVTKMNGGDYECLAD